MSLIDQAANEQPVFELAVAIYRRSARGLVCKVVPLTEGFVVPEGWMDTPAGRVDDEEILQATPEDEPAPKKTKKVTE
jgi:hypothetical protein